MNTTLQRFFADQRLHLTLGDSTITVPKTIADRVMPLCDVAFVDGGHVYAVAKADIGNFGNHMSKDNLIIFDDYPTNWGMAFGKAWEEVLSGKKLRKWEAIDFEGVSR